VLNGVTAVMPAGAPIGSGQGILNPNNIRIILERAKVSRPRTVATHNYGNKTPLHVLAAFPDAILVVHDLHHLGLADRPGAGAERTLIGRARRIVFPSALVLLFLWGSGMWMWLWPFLNRRRVRAKKAKAIG